MNIMTDGGPSGTLGGVQRTRGALGHFLLGVGLSLANVLEHRRGSAGQIVSKRTLRLLTSQDITDLPQLHGLPPWGMHT